MTLSLVKVSRDTHRLVRYAAALEGRTMSEITDQVVEEYLAAHRPEIEAGLESAAAILLGEPS